MIHTLAMASFGHVFIQFLSCTYWIPKVVFHAQVLSEGSRPAHKLDFDAMNGMDLRSSF